MEPVFLVSEIQDQYTVFYKKPLYKQPSTRQPKI